MSKQMEAGLLGEWTAREAEALFTSIMRHTRFVARTKTFLLLLTLLLVGLLVAWPLLNPVGKYLKVTFSAVEKTGEAEKTKMVNPRFQGVDGKGQPYNIVAETALQESADHIRLEKISAEMTLKDGAWISLISTEGMAALHEKKLHLSGSVNVFSDAGYELRSQEALIDLKQSTASSHSPVEGQGPIGIIKAQGFHFKGQEKTLHFEGPVKLTIYPDAGE